MDSEYSLDGFTGEDDGHSYDDGDSGYCSESADDSGEVYLDATGFASLMTDDVSDGDTEDIPGFLSDDDTDIDEEGGAHVLQHDGDDAALAYAVHGYATSSAAMNALGFSATSTGFAARANRNAHSRTRSATFKNRHSNVTTVVRADTGKGEVITVNGVPGSDGERVSKLYEQGRKAAEAARRVYVQSGANAVYQLPPMPWYQHTEDSNLYKRVSPQDTDVVSYVYDRSTGKVKRTVVECKSVKDAVKAARRMTNIHARAENWTPLTGSPPGFEDRITTDMEGSVVKEYASRPPQPKPSDAMDASKALGYAGRRKGKDNDGEQKATTADIGGDNLRMLSTLSKASQDSGPVNIMLALSRHMDKTKQDALSLLQRRNRGDGSFFTTRDEVDKDIKERAELASVLATLSAALKIYVDRRAARQANLPSRAKLLEMVQTAVTVYSTTMTEALVEQKIGRDKAALLAKMQAQTIVREHVQAIVDGKYMNDNYRLGVYMTCFEEAIADLATTSASNVRESLKFRIRSRLAARGAEDATDMEDDAAGDDTDAARKENSRNRFIKTAMSGYLGLMYPALNMLSDTLLDGTIEETDGSPRTLEQTIQAYKEMLFKRMNGMPDKDKAELTNSISYMVETDSTSVNKASSARNFRFIVEKAAQLEDAVDKAFPMGEAGYSVVQPPAGGDASGYAAAAAGGSDEGEMYNLDKAAVRLTKDGAMLAFQKDGKVYRVKAVNLDSFDNMSLNSALKK